MSKSKQQLLDERYLRMARIWAENSYCERRQVGALIYSSIFSFYFLRFPIASSVS